MSIKDKIENRRKELQDEKEAIHEEKNMATAKGTLSIAYDANKLIKDNITKKDFTIFLNTNNAIKNLISENTIF